MKRRCVSHPAVKIDPTDVNSSAQINAFGKLRAKAPIKDLSKEHERSRQAGTAYFAEQT